MHYATVDISKDGAHNFNAPTTHDLGNTGDFQKQIWRGRCGQSRQFQLSFSTSAPFKVPVLAMAVQVEPER